jgi:hypothetical protein
MTALTPRMALPGRTKVLRYSACAADAAQVLHAASHAPDPIVLRTLVTIHHRNLSLSFADFLGVCALALEMADAGSTQRGHA